jgi:hypothetical protein
MKSDVLTLAAVIFVLGTLITSFDIADRFRAKPTPPPSALQQGIAIQN